MSYKDIETVSDTDIEGDYCYGASVPCTTVTYTMAGGGGHWWNYEVQFKEGEQVLVYINSNKGRALQLGKTLFVSECGDYLRLEDHDFEKDDWHPLIHDWSRH